MSASDLLQSATELHRAGRLIEARDRYAQLLEREPRNARAHNLLGVLLGQGGDWAEACRSLEAAAEIDPSRAEYFANLAEARRALGQAADSVAAYRRAIALAPAVASWRFGLATQLEQLGQLDEALTNYQESLKLDSSSAAAHCRLGNVLQRRGLLAQAIAHYRSALQLAPDHVESLINLGNALREDDQMLSALVPLERAVALRPDVAAAHSNLGTVLQDMTRLDEARASYARAIALEPNIAEFHSNLGSVIRDLGDWHGALAECDQAIQLAPHSAQAEYRRGTVLMALGRFAEGLPAYEARIRCPQFQIQSFPVPRWQGEPLNGRTLLVHAEQGLGDTLQFVRYLRRPELQGHSVVLAVTPRLLPLLRESGFAGLVSSTGPLPPFDCEVPLLSLPFVFGTELASIPAEVPYLAAEQERVAGWRRHLRHHASPRVGIVWQGRPSFRGDRLRSIPLTAFAPLAATGATLISLQQGPGARQLAELHGRFNVVEFESPLDRDGAFVDTAAVMKSLDVVITSDTAAAHLAGGLGVPVWLALALAPEWRWMTSGERCPWYPTMRLFRQSKVCQWSDVFERMAASLAELPPDARD